MLGLGLGFLTLTLTLTLTLSLSLSLEGAHDEVLLQLLVGEVDAQLLEGEGRGLGQG